MIKIEEVHAFIAKSCLLKFQNKQNIVLPLKIIEKVKTSKM